jgi:N-acyl-phosphatidylethanolamine-hydrolysing phospholipase D
MTPNNLARRIRWIGGPTFELHLGDLTLLTDPMFSQGPAAFIMNGHPSTGEDGARIARAGVVPVVDVTAVDLLVVSHLHSDHFDREAVERLRKDLLILVPSSQHEILRGWGFTNIRSINWWETHTLDHGSDQIQITAVPARHSADDAANEMLGVVNGYVIPHRSQHGLLRLYWTGDTVWFNELNDMRRRVGEIDVVVPHIGAVGRGGPWGRMTLDAQEAKRLSELFAPALLIPLHHHTFSHYVEPVDALVNLMNRSGAQTRLRVLREGESVELP